MEIGGPTVDNSNKKIKWSFNVIPVCTMACLFNVFEDMNSFPQTIQ